MNDAHLQYVIMTAADQALAYGPVPSRRLGRSLGVNTIPAKVCSYACTYCQVGRTTELISEPRRFYDPAAIVQAVRRRLAILKKKAQPVDYLSIVPDGEPTLDENIGQVIKGLKSLGFR